MDIQIRDRKFKIDTGQNKDAWLGINNNLWENHTFDILDYFVKKDAVFMDLGSWSGVISLYISNIATTIYAIDPDPICYHELQTNIGLNPSVAEKIKTFPFAISEKKEQIRLSARNTYGQSSSSIFSRARDHENSLEITTLSLLQFITQEGIKHVDFIKMDVEGAEFKILPTIAAALQKMNHPTLYISFHYTYLNEHFYFKSIPSRMLNKVLLKIERILGVFFFKKKIHNAIQHLFNDVLSYQYIYTSKGKLISHTFLQEHPDYIKKHDLVFTNTKWVQKK